MSPRYFLLRLFFNRDHILPWNVFFLLVLLLPFCLPPSFSLLCTMLLHNSLSLTLPCLSHAFSLALCLAFLLMFSLVGGVLPHMLFSPIFLCSHCLLWFILSIFAFSSFGRFHLDRFVFFSFALTVYKRYVFLSLYAWNAF